MNIQEYRDKKIEFKKQLAKLIVDFNIDTGTVIQDIDITVENGCYFGRSPQFENIKCKITTDIDE